MDSNSNQLAVAQDGSAAQMVISSNQAVNGDVIIGMDAAVYKAAADGDIEGLKAFPDHEKLQLQLTPKHNTPLHISAQFGQLECLNWILNLPSSSSSSLLLLQRPNLKGDIPLHLAAREGHLGVVRALLDAAAKLQADIETGIGADKLMLRMTNKEKDTALHEAVRYGQYHVVQLLIQKDQKFTYCGNVSGETPLYMAAERGFTETVKIIIEESHKTSTSPAYRGFMGKTALHAAVLCNDEEMTKQILEWNPALTREVDEKGWSPLHCAAERNCDRSIVKLLLQKSEKSVAYLGTKDGNKTALHIASFHHHKNIIEELLSFFPDCCEQVDNDGHNVLHFSMMKKGDHDYMPSDYFDIRWLRARGLVNEKDAQGNTPLHLLSLNQISDYWFLWNWRVDTKAYNNENLTACDIISRAKVDLSGNKDEIQRDFEVVMPETRDSAWQKSFKEMKKRRESKEYKEKYTSELQKQGETHLIVSALITTVTFAAGFTLPGGYKEDDGRAILSKKAAFRAFVVTDTIAMVSSLCAVFLHFFMTMRKGEKFLEKHLVWAFILTMVGMGGMAIAFATGLYAVLPHSSALSFLTCILCSCFFLSFAVEYFQFWRGKVSDMMDKMISSLTKEAKDEE